MQDFNDICEFYNEIKLKLFHGDRNLTLGDILPESLCPLAFHSVYPYIITLSTGGWFNWVAHDEHVIVNCPSPHGIAMYVKAPRNQAAEYIEIEVMKRDNACYKGYELRRVFQFDLRKESISKLGLLYRAIPFIRKRYANGSNECSEVSYDFEGEVARCHVELEGSP